MKYEITMKDHHVALGGEIDSYIYQCGIYFFKVETAFGITTVNTVGADGHYFPKLWYSEKNGSFLEWKEDVSVDGDEWKNFIKEVQNAHEIAPYFLKHIEQLKQGIIPDINED